MRNGGHKLDSNLVKTYVLIIGAGAVGLRAAIELAWQIVDVLVPVTILLEAGAIEPGTELALNFPQFSGEERSILEPEVRSNPDVGLAEWTGLGLRKALR